MSWGFGGLASAVPNATAGGNAGPDLESIETEKLGFQALSGDRKIKLLPSPWPTDSQPSKTASLLTVASSRGLLVAAGPEQITLYETDAIRAAFAQDGSGDIKDLTPKVQVDAPRVSHVAFSNDEHALVIVAESGGGLAVYDANKLAPGVSPALQISTNGVAIRHLLPNPNKEYSHLFAAVLEDGSLVMANLQSQELAKTSDGNTTFKSNVSCASWSRLGKQIIAGLADGMAVQLDMQGNQKEQIPRPPKLGADFHMNAVYWLETFAFLTIHTSTAPEDPMDMDGVYHVVHRDKDTKAYSFQRFSVAPCTVMEERLPAHFFMQRIRDWHPNLDDTIIIASSASTDVGLLTRSKIALSADGPAEQITHAYTTTAAPDTRRAQLPMAADGASDTFPIGVVLDLSSKQKVPKPIPSDETLEESSTPLPQYCILNQEGYLSAWWYIYNEAVQQGVAAPNPATSTDRPTSSSQITPTISRPTAATSGSGQDISTNAQASAPASGFGQPSKPISDFGSPAFGQPSVPAPAFGQPSAPSMSFGQPTASSTAFGQAGGSTFGKPAFGGSSTLGQNSSPWATPSATASTGGSFGKPSFGSTSQLGTNTGQSAFGQLGGMGVNKASPWGAPSTVSPFASTSPFASSASQASPFATMSTANKDNASDSQPAFGAKQSEGSPFASLSSSKDTLSPFASMSKPGMPNETSFGSTVTLGSITGSSFGSGSTFGTAPLGKAQENKDESMDDVETPREEKTQASALGGLSGFKLGSTFKPDNSSGSNLPISKDVSNSLFGTGFGAALGDVAKDKPTSIIKNEPVDSSPLLKDIPSFSGKQNAAADDAPLPPDPVPSKSNKTVSFENDAPLPPDFTAKPSEPIVDAAPLPPDFTTIQAKITDAAPLPPDFLPKATAKPATSGSTSRSRVAPEQESVPLPADDAESDLDGDLEDDDEIEDGDEEEQEDADASDPQEDDDDDEWDDEEEDAEDEDEDSRVIVNPTKLSAFEARLAPASPAKSTQEDHSTTPETVHKPSFTPAGFPKAPLNFAPTRKVETSPRSPSPVRAVTSPVRFSNLKPPVPAEKNISVAQTPLKPVPDWSTSMRQKPQPPTIEELEDAEDIRRREIITAPLVPRTTIAPFIAHQDYMGTSNKDGLAGQLERVYRDINSMIDTLGLNARALQEFVAGQDQSRSQELSAHDLQDEDGWVLCELPALDRIEGKLADDLEAGKLVDVNDKINDILEQDEQMTHMKAKTIELRKQLSNRTDPEKRAQQQAQPLPQAWAAQQIELRQSLQQVHSLLAKVEDSISVLRAELATASAVTADSGIAVPTVEAVVKTITKMTAMIEKKSGDVDVLEAQIRRLPTGSLSLEQASYNEEDLVDSLAASRISNGSYSTPRRQPRAEGNPLGMSAMLGSICRTPPSARSNVMFDPSASLLGRSMASLNGSARKKMSDVTTEEVEAWKAKIGRRRKVLSTLRHVVDHADDRTIHVTKA